MITERSTLVRHLIDDEGVRSGGNITVSGRPGIEHAVIEEAWVRQPSGEVENFDADALQVVSNPDPDVFSDSQDLVLPFSRLVPGATIGFVVKRVMDPKIWPLPWARSNYTQILNPVENFRLDVTWQNPSQRPRVASNDPALTCTRDERAVRCARSAVPAAHIDPSVAWADELPHVTVSTTTSWNALARAEREVVMNAVAQSKGVRETVTMLGLGDMTASDRLRRIHRFVADEIRYVAFEHGTSAVVPHSAARTLSRRYGDCKDKVVLFLALARAADLDAFGVLVGTARKSIEGLLLPSWRYFDHMIACTRNAAALTCFDLTDPHSKSGALPLMLQGAVALELEETPRRQSR